MKKKLLTTTVKFILTLILLNQSINSFAQLHGNYTINPGASASASNYKTFASAISDMSLGTRADGGPVNGPAVSAEVIFSVAAATYNETPSVPVITGASSINRIIFDGGVGNASTRIVSNTNGSYVVEFNCCSYVTFQNLTITNSTTGGNNSSVVWFNGLATDTASTNDKVSNCIINSGIFASTGFNFWYAVYFSGPVSYSLVPGYFSNDTVTGCTISGGEYGIAVDGNTTSQPTGIVISNNTVNNYYQYGIFLDNCAAPKIKGNILSTETNYGNSYGIDIAACIPGVTDFTDVSDNKIPELGRGGIYISSDIANASYPTMIYNNFIGGVNNNSTGQIRGIYLNASKYVDIWFNSINLNNTTTSVTAGSNVGLSDNLGTSTYLDIRDNIFCYYPSSGTGVSSTCIPLYFGASFVAGNITNFDYNIFYSNYNNGGSYYEAYMAGVAYTTSTIIGALGFNSNSFVVNPNFKSTTDLHIQNTTLAQLGVALPEVTTDIDGETRPATPHIGADDFPVIGNNDLSVSAITSPVNLFVPGSNTLTVTVTNVGTNTVASGNIYYALNGSTFGPLSLSSIMPLTTGKSASYSFTTPVSFNVGGSAIKVFTSLPNGVMDSYAPDDTVSVTLYSRLNSSVDGVYTLNNSQQASAINFPNFTAAAAALNCGLTNVVQGPVTINVAPGTYNEQIEIEGSSGVSSTNQITFNGNSASSVTLEYNGVYGLSHTVRLKGASYVNFSNMTITTLSLSYGWPVHFFGNYSNYCKFNNCILSVPTNNGENLVPVMAAGQTGIAPSIVIGGMLAAYDTISNCTITNGNYGIDWYGTGDGTNCVDNVFRENAFTNNNGAGVNLSETFATKVLNNTIALSGGSGILTYNCGISATTTPDFMDLSGNDITGVTGGQSFSGGITGSGLCGSPLTHNRISNNFIITSSNANNALCLDFSNVFQEENTCASYADISFNTLVYNGSASSYGNCMYDYSYAGTEDFTFTNNICAITNATATNAEPIWEDGQNFTNCDYNIFYNIANSNVFYDGTTTYTFANVVGADILNANSQVNSGVAPGTNPNFIGGSNYNISEQCKRGVPIPGITTDFYGTTRSSNHPCIGADEIPTLTVTVSDTNASCSNCADGGALAVVTFGLPPYKFNWSNNDTTQSVSDLLPGKYTVCITDSAGCSVCDSFFVSFATGVNSMGLKTGIEIWPNPNLGIFTVKVNAAGINKIQIFNLTGEEVYEENINGAFTKAFDLTDYAKGVYILQVTSGNDVIRKKVVVQ